MATEQSQTLKTLQLAIQMEIDGKAFYQKASRESGHEMGKKLLATLAKEEDLHLRTFEAIYEALRKKQGWPSVNFQLDKGKTIKTIFAEAAQEISKSTTSELDAVQTAIDMENKSHDLYQKQSEATSHVAEKSFFQSLAGEERGHQLALVDYMEFLKDPAGWFVKKEHHSLDGG